MIGITGTGIQNSIYVDGYREECGDTVTTIFDWLPMIGIEQDILL